ncbi:sodium/proton antiporter, CPA1 family [Faunimonas pinastri]|uniref:Sodium/proton antiporter, CPA1 family n=1 Tax=Faunimonas pinastri TaxID=1855383 RepID=A0A1H9FJ41_9HYPH|nr:sodium:proton antiporter [Faunimonas pinastri]SEQ37912.1 sodium/proton antiporter, CPA1 family [Faunimonas pinastri]
MDTGELIALLLVLSAVCSWINSRFLRQPNAIGVLVVTLVGSIIVLIVDRLVPSLPIHKSIEGTINKVDFYKTFMNGMLAFLLFAGALNVDAGRLKQERWAVGALATVGVILSTLIVGTCVWQGSRLLGSEMPAAWAYVFGALISPTDPVAVLAILKTLDIPKPLEVRIVGESLFNDGVGIVVFTIALALAQPNDQIHLSDVGLLFLREALGSVVLGAIGGWIAVRAIKSIDNPPVEILITLATVAGLYTLATDLETSAPVTVVVAGILVGSRGADTAMSETTKGMLFQFWELVDELLNCLLFLLIGLQLLVLPIAFQVIGLAVLAVISVFVGRLVSVSVPILLLLKGTFATRAIPIMTWGGVRGGISIALALSIGDPNARTPIVLATYAVVIFSILIQGLTMRFLIQKTPFESVPND